MVVVVRSREGSPAFGLTNSPTDNIDSGFGEWDEAAITSVTSQLKIGTVQHRMLGCRSQDKTHEVTVASSTSHWPISLHLHAALQHRCSSWAAGGRDGGSLNSGP